MAKYKLKDLIEVIDGIPPKQKPPKLPSDKDDVQAKIVNPKPLPGIKQAPPVKQPIGV